MIKKISSILVLLIALMSLSINAATICVGPSATGNGSGSDFNNLRAWSATPSRGDTWYLVDGTYSGKTFNTAVSGASWVIIKKATVGDRNVENIAGWSSSLGDGQATFTSGISVTTSYIMLDGVKGNPWDKNPANYGFGFATMNFPIRVGSSTVNITDISLSRFSATGTTADVEKYFSSSPDDSRNITNYTLSYCYADRWANHIKGTGGAGHGQRVRVNWITEYNVFLNTHSSGAVHGESINNGYGNMQGWHIRYNLIEGIANQPPTGVIVVLNDDSGAYHIYGNVIKDFVWAEVGIGGIHHPMSGTIYNNTFINNRTPYNYNNWVGGGAGTVSIVRNNLIVNQAADRVGGNISFNTYANCTRVPTGESGIQILPVSPLVNAAGGNFHLVSATAAGVSTPYNKDFDGKIRGGDGVWDRGAFEFVATNQPPTNTFPTITLTSPQNGSYQAPASIAFSATASDPDGSVNRVEFLNGNTVVNTDTTSPYNYLWNGVGAGTYFLSAKVYDNLGLAVSSSISQVVVTNVVNQPCTNYVFITNSVPVYITNTVTQVVTNTVVVTNTTYLLPDLESIFGVVNNTNKTLKLDIQFKNQ